MGHPSYRFTREVYRIVSQWSILTTFARMRVAPRIREAAREAALPHTLRQKNAKDGAPGILRGIEIRKRRMNNFQNNVRIIVSLGSFVSHYW